MLNIFSVFWYHKYGVVYLFTLKFHIENVLQSISIVYLILRHGGMLARLNSFFSCFCCYYLLLSSSFAFVFGFDCIGMFSFNFLLHSTFQRINKVFGLETSKFGFALSANSVNKSQVFFFFLRPFSSAYLTLALLHSCSFALCRSLSLAPSPSVSRALSLPRSMVCLQAKAVNVWSCCYFELHLDLLCICWPFISTVHRVFRLYCQVIKTYLTLGGNSVCHCNEW